MGILARLERLENDMFERKINEKIKEYEEKYNRHFAVYGDPWGIVYLSVDGNRHLHLGYCSDKEEKYEKLCECEIEIKAWLYDEMQIRNSVENSEE